MIRIGYGRNARAKLAVARCVAAIGPERPELLIAFCGGKLDPEQVILELRDAYGPVRIVGGAAAGAISRGGSGYSGIELGIMAFDKDDPVPEVLVAELGEDEEASCQGLGERLREVVTDGSVVLLLFDSVAQAVPLRLHPASQIVRGVLRGLQDRRVQLLGGGLLTDMNLGDGWVFDGTTVRKHIAVALAFPPDITAETVILHGCRPVSTFMRITRIEGAEVFELDGQPALGVIEQMLGLSLGSAREQDLSLIATLGQKQGDLYAPYDENDYVNRLILTANPRSGSVTLFEPDFQAGSMVQIMSRDNSLMLESAAQGTASLVRSIAGRDALFGLYIDCAGRASARSGAPIEEADIIIRGMPASLPFLGFYSGVEVAPFDQQARPLDWTGVLTVLCRQK